MHVRDQIVEAFVGRILTHAGHVLGDRAYAHRATRWNFEDTPIAVVFGGRTTVDEEGGSENELERRETEIVVQVLVKETPGADVNEQIGDLAVLVEKAVHEILEDVQVETVTTLGDEGVNPAQVAADGTFAGTQISFGVGYYTRKGNAAAFAAGNY